MTAVRNAKAFAEGAAVGGTTSAAIGLAVAKGVAVLAKAAPVAGMVAGRAIPVLGLAVVGAGAVYGGVQAYRHGGNVVAGAFAGSLGITPAYADGKRRRQAHGAPADETPTQRRERVAAPFGFPPEDTRLAIDNQRKAMTNAKTEQERNWHERRLLGLEALMREDEARSKGPATPPAKGLVAQAHDTLFGEAKPKPEDALSKQRRELEKSIDSTRAEMADEAKSTRGPKYNKLQDRLKEDQQKLDVLTKRQEGKSDAEAAAYRTIGALLGGAALGGFFSRGAKVAAHKAAAVAEKGIGRLAERAAQLIKAAPRGVIAGTVPGDQAAAAVSAARHAASTPTVGRVEAYGLPAFNVLHGGAAYALSEYDKDNPAAPLMRAEGQAAIAAGAFGFKFGMAARAVRPFVSPTVAGQLAAVENRLAREMTRGGGPAGVAQARGRRAVAVASGRAGVAQAEGRSAVGLASTRGQAAVAVAGHQATGRLASAKYGADVRAVSSGSRVGVAKAEGAARVERAEIRGKQSTSRLMANGERLPKYKDTWQDTRGRVYHRKDMGVRKPGKGPANDNRGGSRAAGRG